MRTIKNQQYYITLNFHLFIFTFLHCFKYSSFETNWLYVLFLLCSGKPAYFLLWNIYTDTFPGVYTAKKDWKSVGRRDECVSPTALSALYREREKRKRAEALVSDFIKCHIFSWEKRDSFFCHILLTKLKSVLPRTHTLFQAFFLFIITSTFITVFHTQKKSKAHGAAAWTIFF